MRVLTFSVVIVCVGNLFFAPCVYGRSYNWDDSTATDLGERYPYLNYWLDILYGDEDYGPLIRPRSRNLFDTVFTPFDQMGRFVDNLRKQIFAPYPRPIRRKLPNSKPQEKTINKPKENDEIANRFHYPDYYPPNYGF